MFVAKGEVCTPPPLPSRVDDVVAGTVGEAGDVLGPGFFDHQNIMLTVASGAGLAFGQHDHGLHRHHHARLQNRFDVLAQLQPGLAPVVVAQHAEGMAIAEGAAQRAKAAALEANVAADKFAQRETNVTSIITKGGATAGAIGIAIFLMQIFVASMRYYARLSEFYDAQADALRTSCGNPDYAERYLKSFSPAVVDFGKIPTTFYEKLIDVAGGAVSTRTK